MVNYTVEEKVLIKNTWDLLKRISEPYEIDHLLRTTDCNLICIAIRDSIKAHEVVELATISQYRRHAIIVGTYLRIHSKEEYQRYLKQAKLVVKLHERHIQNALDELLQRTP